MASTSNPSTQGPILNDKKYSIWAIKMKSYLKNLDFWEAIETKYEEPSAQELAQMTNAQRNAYVENKRKDSRALWNIVNGVEESIFSKISATTNAYQAWEILATTYQGVEKVKNAKLQILRKRFESLQMKDTETVDQFMS